MMRVVSAVWIPSDWRVMSFGFAAVSMVSDAVGHICSSSKVVRGMVTTVGRAPG